MASSDVEKTTAANERPASDTHSAEEAGIAASARSRSWKYREFSILGYRVWYASPPAQLLIVSFVCFLCPGMFNALSGMGGGGQVDTSAANKANIALYSTFAVVGFMAGTIANTLGIKFALGFGGLGYSVYVASFLSFSHTSNYGFTIFAGAFLGVCAGLLWCAQGAIMMSYPAEESKGRYISWFWMIFNLGAVIGSLVSRARCAGLTTSSTSKPLQLSHPLLTTPHFVTPCRFPSAKTSTPPPTAPSVMAHISVSSSLPCLARRWPLPSSTQRAWSARTARASSS